MLVFDWIYSPQDIKHNRFRTWRSGQGSFIDPSVISIQRRHQLSKWHLVRFVVSNLIHLEGVKKAVYQIYLLLTDWLIIVVPIKDYSNGRGNHLVRHIVGVVHNVHFKIVSVSINCVLRGGVKVELVQVELLIAWQLVLHILRSEKLGLWNHRQILNNCLYWKVRIPLYY